jgi:SH3-like domain-containing protein
MGFCPPAGLTQGGGLGAQHNLTSLDPRGMSAFASIPSLALAAALALSAIGAAVSPLVLGGPALAQSESETSDNPGVSGLPLPRFVSLRAPKVNLRTGPGVRYPIEWVYHRAGLPLEVIDEFETWRQVRDWEGSVGWVHQSMLSGERKVMVSGKERLLRRDPSPAAVGVALLQPQVIGDLRRCQDAWCEIGVGDKAGWLRRIDLYGLYPDEIIH